MTLPIKQKNNQKPNKWYRHYQKKQKTNVFGTIGGQRIIDFLSTSIKTQKRKGIRYFLPKTYDSTNKTKKTNQKPKKTIDTTKKTKKQMFSELLGPHPFHWQPHRHTK